MYYEGTSFDVIADGDPTAMVTPMWDDERGVQGELAVLHTGDNLTNAQMLALAEALRTVAELDAPNSVGVES